MGFIGFLTRRNHNSTADEQKLVEIARLDGIVDPDEGRTIVDQAQKDGVTDAERSFLHRRSQDDFVDPSAQQRLAKGAATDTQTPSQQVRNRGGA